MERTVKFTKMQGAGNDYIYVNTMLYEIPSPEVAARKWSCPHTGIGSDGLVLIGRSDKADFSMRIFNADGSEARMCGNASRCIGKYVYEKRLTDKRTVTLDTLSGIRTLYLGTCGDKVTDVCVDMGMAADIRELSLDGPFPYNGISLSMGNPHFVIFTDNAEKADPEKAGPVIETHPAFPDRTNVEFVQVLDKRRIRMRVWERGSGITKACGTGACAAAAASAFAGLAGDEVTVVMDGGSLGIRITPERHIMMTGPAVTVFEGEIEYDI